MSELPVRDTALLEQALTHKSLVPHAPLQSNERLEFLGDAVLGLVVGEYLFAAYPERGEGQLAKARALIVCKTALAAAAARLGLPPLLKLSRAEEALGGRERDSLAADAFEAVVAAVYTEGGYGAARAFVLSSLAPEIDAVAESADWRDAKSVLQEQRQAAGLSAPVYVVTGEDGLPHARTFTVDVVLDGTAVGTGTGKTKKDAQQAAALAALAVVEQNNAPDSRN